YDSLAPPCCVFFFQAEDGIRDLIVTGVQTCALPISLDKKRALEPCRPAGEGFWCEANSIRTTANSQAPTNAEGRGHSPDLPICPDRKSVRVGKECRSRWCGDQ